MSFLNSNTQNLKPSATLEINEKVNNLRKEGRTIYHFGFGQSPFPISTQIVGALIANANKSGYLPTLGLPQLRAQIASFLSKHQDLDASAQRILIGPGSKELLYQTILMIDGTYLIPKGSWVSYLPQVKLNQKKFALLETKWEHNYKLQPQVLKSQCEKIAGTKILILNSPNNPTGAVYTPDELKALAEICRKHSLIVLSDEIYSQLSFQTDHAASISKLYPENSIVFGGLSKVFAAGGYRLGYLHLPSHLDYLTDTYAALFSETFSAVSAPIQHAAITAFTYGKEVREDVEAARTILSAFATYVYQTLTEAGIACTQPEGGFYMLIDFRNYKKQLQDLQIDGSVSLAHHLLEHFDVALLPGTDFYFSPEEFIFRLAYVDFDGKKVISTYQKNKNIPLDIKFIETFAPNVFKGIQNIIRFVNSFA
jgi:aspartate aminotransferase